MHQILSLKDYSLHYNLYNVMVTTCSVFKTTCKDKSS